MNDNMTYKGTTNRAALQTALLFLSVSLAACSGMTNSDAPPPCPPVSTLPDAATITRFTEGPGRDLIDIDFSGRITQLRGKCFYEIDSESGEGLVRVKITPEFKIDRGAANKTRQADFHYFVSILDANGSILDKQVFPYTAKYWKNRLSLKDTDAPVELSIPLMGGLTGQDFSIFVGFQLSQDELDFNREKIGR